ncbi:MAG: hypothetical protein ACM32O_06245 [Clostridia bacterium]
MMSTVYRGITLTEALQVVRTQKYEREERRYFLDGVVAKAVFGQGIYLVHDSEMAAQYAFCHAESEHDLAAVLRQELTFSNPMILHAGYSERDLRRDALAWKFKDGHLPPDLLDHDTLHRIEKIGSVMKQYLLEHQFDGITYHVNDDLIYSISYFPESQIQSIQIDFIFDIHELKHATVQMLRDRYKQNGHDRVPHALGDKGPDSKRQNPLL